MEFTKEQLEHINMAIDEVTKSRIFSGSEDPLEEYLNLEFDDLQHKADERDCLIDRTVSYLSFQRENNPEKIMRMLCELDNTETVPESAYLHLLFNIMHRVVMATEANYYSSFSLLCIAQHLTNRLEGR